MKIRPSHQCPWDVFISYAHEDREPFVISLVRSLRVLSMSVWYDEFRLKPGDSLRKAIDAGIKGSRFGVVVLSLNFFRKLWTNRELDGLLAVEGSRRKVILPIWHNITFHDVRRFSPIVASRAALRSTEGAQSIAQEIRKLVRPRICFSCRPFDGKTNIMIIPDDGLVWVDNDRPGRRASAGHIYDYSGREVDFFEEEEARFRWLFHPRKHDFRRGCRFEFSGRIGVVQINDSLCSETDINQGLVIPGKPLGIPVPFHPIFVSPGCTVGIFNKDVLDAVEGAS